MFKRNLTGLLVAVLSFSMFSMYGMNSEHLFNQVQNHLGHDSNEGKQFYAQFGPLVEITGLSDMFVDSNLTNNKINLGPSEKDNKTEQNNLTEVPVEPIELGMLEKKYWDELEESRGKDFDTFQELNDIK